LDNDLKIKQVSDPFYFREKNIEFCIMEWIPISNQIHLKITNIRKLGVFDRMERKFRKRNFKFNENKIFFDETLPNHEDLDCWIRIFSLKPRVVFNKDVLAVYRVRDNSMSRDYNAMFHGFVQVLQKHLDEFHADSYLSETIQQRLNLLHGLHEKNTFIKVKNHSIFHQFVHKCLQKLKYIFN
jgi:hypothetical protein